MKTLTFTGQKGGTGKTTLATHMAGMLAAQGRRVLIIDADNQRSAQEWWEMRPPSLPALQLVQVPGTPEDIRSACESPGAQAADFVILDTPGRISAGVRQAVRLSDFVVIPLLPSLPDVRSIERFYREVLAEVAGRRTLRGTLVLNGMQRGVGLCQEAQAYLREQTELPVCEAVVHQYVAFRRAIGLGQTVSELAPRSRAAHDMQALFDVIKEEIERE